jgi:regulator of RNase E activity RraA
MVADGDGVIVVPVEKAEAVAQVAIQIQEGDKEDRRQLYGELALPSDFTVEPR